MMKLALGVLLGTAAAVRLPARVGAPALPQQLPSRRGRVVAVGPELLHSSTLMLADAASAAASAAAAPEVRQTEEAIRAASGELGWWGTYIKTVEDGLIGLRNVYGTNGVPYPLGFAIFTFVLGVKLVTLPLNWNQLSSAASMKAVKPQQDLVNKWYGDNKQLQGQEVGDLYEKLSVNPLAGCLPSLAQIPVFLGVYYSVTSIAKARLFDEGFLWIPSLIGPISDRREGISWLTEGWINGAPRLGWHDTLAYLTIPLILVCTQTLSLYLLGSFDALGKDKNSETTALVLRGLPFMIGWFAMNAPAGLGLYWVFNNILTTTTTVVVKKIVEKPELIPEVDDLLLSLGERREALPELEAVAPDWTPGGGGAAGKAVQAAGAVVAQEAAA